MDGRNTTIECDCKGDIGITKMIMGEGKITDGEGGREGKKGKLNWGKRGGII